jgi:hypothetical protein
MNEPTIKVLGVYRLNVTDELVRRQHSVLHGEDVCHVRLTSNRGDSAIDRTSQPRYGQPQLYPEFCARIFRRSTHSLLSSERQSVSGQFGAVSIRWRSVQATPKQSSGPKTRTRTLASSSDTGVFTAASRVCQRSTILGSAPADIGRELILASSTTAVCIALSRSPKTRLQSALRQRHHHGSSCSNISIAAKYQDFSACHSCGASSHHDIANLFRSSTSRP